MESISKRTDRKNKLIISISILAILISLYAVYFNPFHRENPVVRLREELSDLRSMGLPIESVYSDDESGCLVVEFSDMEPEYVETIQGIVGYDVPILFRELESKSVLSGEPPSQPFELCNALNTLAENLDYHSHDIDLQEGLLILEFEDLKEEDMQEIIGVAGDEVAIKFVERPWRDSIYVGMPSSDTESIEAAEERLNSSIQSGDRDTIARTRVEKSAGFLEVHLYDLDDYGEPIEAIRSIVGLNTPLIFVLTRETQPKRQSHGTAESVLDHYIGLLNLSDVGYDVLWKDKQEGEASICFCEDGDRYPFQTLRLNKTGGSWERVGRRQWGVASPSRDVEILGYHIRLTSAKGTKIVSRLTPLVRNSGDGTAYIWSIDVKIVNATHAYNQTYLTVGFDLWNGLVGSGETEFVDVGGSFTSLGIPLDGLRGGTYTVSVVLRDGDENMLAERSFTHTFSSLPP